VIKIKEIYTEFLCVRLLEEIYLRDHGGNWKVTLRCVRGMSCDGSR
jgi:hypothetical protein